MNPRLRSWRHGVLVQRRLRGNTDGNADDLANTLRLDGRDWFCIYFAPLQRVFWATIPQRTTTNAAALNDFIAFVCELLSVRTVAIMRERDECLGLWAQFFQGPYIPPKDTRVIVFAAYSCTAGAHPLSLTTNGLPTDRTCWRLYHLMPKLFRQKFPHIVVPNLLDHVAFLDYSSISVSGKLGKGKDAPKVLLANNASYTARRSSPKPKP